jgi:hypothetical protein
MPEDYVAKAEALVRAGEPKPETREPETPAKAGGAQPAPEK